MNLYGFPITQPIVNPNKVILTKKALGDLGELTAARYFTHIGMSARKSRSFQGDLAVVLNDAQSTVEVKTAFRDKRGVFQFNLYRKVNGKVRTDHRHADVLVLLCVQNDYSVTLLVLPSSLVKTQKVEFRNPHTSKYRGYIAEG